VRRGNRLRRVGVGRSGQGPPRPNLEVVLPIPIVSARHEDATPVCGELDVLLEPGERVGGDRFSTLGFDRHQSATKVENEVDFAPANVSPVEHAWTFTVV
jgi:hypothetical protein